MHFSPLRVAWGTAGNALECHLNSGALVHFQGGCLVVVVLWKAISQVSRDGVVLMAGMRVMGREP